MQEEFTTEMHSELLEVEMSRSDVMVMGVFAAMRRYGSLMKALADYPKMTADIFKSNVVRVIEFDNWDEFYGRYGKLLDA